MIPQGTSLRIEKCDTITMDSDDDFHLWDSSVCESHSSPGIRGSKRHEHLRPWQRDISWIELSDEEVESSLPSVCGIVGKRKKENTRREPRWWIGKVGSWKSMVRKATAKTSSFIHRLRDKSNPINPAHFVSTMTEEDALPLVTISHVYTPLEESTTKDEEEFEISHQWESETYITETAGEKVHYEMVETASGSLTKAPTQLKVRGRKSNETFSTRISIEEKSAYSSQKTQVQQDQVSMDVNRANANKTKDLGATDSLTTPPVFEVSNYHRTLSSDISDVSSLSGTYQMPLEFSLGSGFGSRTPYLLAMSENIVRNLELLELREAETTTKCLVLIMDPRQKIFEIVPVPYTFDGTTIGDILAKLPSMATDRRLAKLKFSGLSYEGICISAPMVPVEIILDALSTRRPLFAIPEKYSATEIEELGVALVQTPSVAKLIQDQLDKLERTNAVTQPRPSQFLDAKSSDFIQIPRRVTSNSSHFFTRQTKRRVEVENIA